MKRLFIFLALFVFKAYAQPGGGGGLQIKNFYNERLELIDASDESFKIRSFVLADTTFNSKIIQEHYPRNNQYLRQDLRNYRYLPGNYERPTSRIYFGAGNQRMLIVKGKDSMIVDFHNIIPENPGGAIDMMDSLVFKSGHFIYNRWATQSEVGVENYPEYYKIFRNGLTKNTRKKLKKYGKIKYSPKVNVSFLAKKNLPATYYLRRGENFKSGRNLDNCINDIVRAQHIGLKENEYEQSLLLLTEIYDKKKNYGKAIAAISKLLEIRLDEIYHYDGNVLYRIKENYRTRIRLYIKKNELERAKIDFDSLVSFSRIHSSYENGKGYYMEKVPIHYPLRENVERALFKIKYLKDYSDVIDDLQERILRIPENHLEGKPYASSVYNETYFTLGLAQYHKGDFENAVKNWLMAMEFGYETTGRNHVIKHFDTIIPKHGDIPELYLSRAIANYKLASPSQKKAIRENHLEKSLNDLKQAEILGFSDFRLNYYRTKALRFLKQYEKALEEINIAIKKNNKNPMVYHERHYVRRQMNEIPYEEYRTDSDFLIYERLRESWTFPK